MAEQVRAAVADWTFAIGGGRSIHSAGQHFDTTVVTAVHQVVARLGPGAFVNSAHAATNTERPGEIAV